MAKLRVGAQLLLDSLFGGCEPTSFRRITAASYDFASDVVVLEISGDDVPEGDEVVVAEFTKHATTIKFKRA